MEILIYIFSGLFIPLLVYGFYQLQLERMDDTYRRFDKDLPILYKMFKPIIQILAKYNQRMDAEKLDEKYKMKLVRSGNPLHLIAVEFVAIKQISCFVGILFGGFVVFGMEQNITWLFVISILAYFLPGFLLSDMTNRRKQTIALDLPYALDLLTLSVEAGLTFILAMDKVVKKGQPGPVRDEFAKMLQDLRLGLSLRDSLEGLAERTDMSEVRSFTSALIQADRLGTPIGDTLRTQAEIRRTERFQNAEKRAQEAPVKLLLPLLVFIFPAVFIVILGPVLLRFFAEGGM